jgi:hypothetical protein
LQIAGGSGNAVITGEGITTSIAVAELVQPVRVFVPVELKTEEATAVNVLTDVLDDPIDITVVVNDPTLPEHKVMEPGEIVTVG